MCTRNRASALVVPLSVWAERKSCRECNYLLSGSFVSSLQTGVGTSRNTTPHGFFSDFSDCIGKCVQPYVTGYFRENGE